MREPAVVCSTANNGAGELCRALPRSGATITMLAWARPYDSLGWGVPGWRESCLVLMFGVRVNETRVVYGVMCVVLIYAGAWVYVWMYVYRW